MSKLDYGDKFYDWVVMHGREASTASTRHDFRLRTYNGFIFGIHEINRVVDRVMATLPALVRAMEAEEAHLAGLPEVTAALSRKASASRHMEELFRLETSLGRGLEVANMLNDLGQARWFHSAALYQVGRDGLLNSLVEYGQGAIDTMDGHYPVHVSATVGENGQGSISVAPGDAAASGATVTAAILMQVGASAYIPVLAVVLLGYYIWRDIEYRTQIRAQNARVREALLRFSGTEALDPAMSYAVWCEELAVTRALLGPEVEKSVGMLSDLAKGWKQAFTATAARLRLSGMVLTTEKVSVLMDQGGRQDLVELQLLPTLLATSREVSSFTGDVKVRGFALAPQLLGANAARDLEGYTDASHEGLAVYRYLRGHSFFVSLHEKLDRHIATLSVRAAAAAHLVARLEAGDRPERPFSALDSDGALPLGALPEDEDTAQDEPSAPSLLPSHQSFGLLDGSRTETPSAYLGLSIGDTYGVVLGSPPGGLYDDALGGGQGDRTFNSVLGHYRDGGMARDNRRADRALDAFQRNLNERWQGMANIRSRLEASTGEWLTAAAAQRELQTVVIDRMAQTATFLSSDLSSRTDLQHRLLTDGFLRDPFRPGTVRTTVQELGHGGSIFPALDPAETLADGTSFTVLDHRSTAFGDQAGNTVHPRIWRESGRQSAKFARDEAIVRARVATHRASGTPDPVFRDDDELEEVMARVRDRIAQALRFADRMGASFRRFGQDAVAAAERFLDEAAGLRLYARRRIDEQPQRTLGPAEVQRQQAELTTRIADYRKTSGTWRAPHACNVFLEKVLEDTWGATELVDPDPQVLALMGYPPGAKLDFANEAIRYIAADTEHYRYVGLATDQSALDDAGHLANQGLAVIFTQVKGEPDGPGGHVALGRPGSLSRTSGVWKAVKAEYGKLRMPWVTSFSVDGPIHELNVLSYAWSSPEGVHIYVRRLDP